MASTSDLGSEVYARIQDVPSTISIGSIVTTLGFIINDVTNYTGEAISTSDVPSKYQNILINLGCAYVLCNKLGVGVDFDFQLGEFSVDRGNLSGNADSRSIEFFITQANNSMRYIGRETRWAKTWGV